MSGSKKVLITGGTGFIGSHVVRKLVRLGYECVVFTRRDIDDLEKVRYVKLDIAETSRDVADRVMGQEGKAEAIIYLAANIPLIGQPKESYLDAKHSTLDPLVSFCQHFAPYAQKFVYASSIDVMGVPEVQNYDESCSPSPATPYGLAKYCGEFYVNSICRQLGIKATILRFSQVYGYNEPLVRVIPILLQALRTNGQFYKFTTGNEKRRFLYVSDAADAVYRALESDNTGVYNVAGKSVDSINDLISMAEGIYNKNLDVVIKGEHIAYDNVPSILKAESGLGFSPQYSLEDGIKEIYGEDTNANTR